MTVSRDISLVMAIHNILKKTLIAHLGQSCLIHLSLFFGIFKFFLIFSNVLL